VRESEIGLAFGLLETANSIAIIAAPAAAGFLYDLDPYAMFYTSLGMILVMIICSRLLLPRLQKKAAAGPHFPVTETIP
jgi:MFS family permease